MKASSSQTNFLYVVFFSQECSCARQGEADIKRHILTKTHKDKPSSLRQQPTINVVLQNDPLTFKTSRAEVLMIILLLKTICPLLYYSKQI